MTKEKKVIVCRVEFDGELKANKPMFFPEFDHKQQFDMSVVTTKDIRDIHSSIKLGVDFISVSYVESKQVPFTLVIHIGYNGSERIAECQRKTYQNHSKDLEQKGSAELRGDFGSGRRDYHSQRVLGLRHEAGGLGFYIEIPNQELQYSW